jgi:hypothetical protein
MPFWTVYVLVGLGVAICGLLAWMILLQTRLQRLQRQHTKLMTGASGANLEELLNQHLDEVRQTLETVSALEARTRTIERTLQHTVQWMGMIRYNPFRNTGGAQSFALAIVDGNGDGAVISSLHARENTRVYAKPLHQWTSEHTLTDEEQQAIARAQASAPQQP